MVEIMFLTSIVSPHSTVLRDSAEKQAPLSPSIEQGRLGAGVRLTWLILWVSVSPSAKKALPLPHRMFTNIIDQRTENTKGSTSASLALAFSSTEWESLPCGAILFPVLGPSLLCTPFSSCSFDGGYSLVAIARASPLRWLLLHGVSTGAN